MRKGKLIVIEPKKISPDVVQHYCKHARRLLKSNRDKAKKFVELECIKYIGKDDEFGSKYCFACLPINEETEIEINGNTYSKKPHRFYNSSIYKMWKMPDGNWTCSCQGWKDKFEKKGMQNEGILCSHTLALMYGFKLGIFRRENNVEN